VSCVVCRVSCVSVATTATETDERGIIR